MSNSRHLWTAFRNSKDWRCRPSEIYGIEDAFTAYCFDNAVNTFGTALQQELESVESKQKDPKRAQKELEALRTGILKRWLFITDEEAKASDAAKPAKPATQFADPAKLMGASRRGIQPGNSTGSNHS